MNFICDNNIEHTIWYTHVRYSENEEYHEIHEDKYCTCELGEDNQTTLF